MSPSLRLHRSLPCLLTMRPYMIWTFLVPQLTLVIYIFIFLKFSNLVPTTWFSQLTLRLPEMLSPVLYKAGFFSYFRSQLKCHFLHEVFPWPLYVKWLYYSPLSYCLFFLIFITDSLTKHDESSTSVNPPVNSQCLAWELIINTHLLNEWMIPSVAHVSNTDSFFTNLSKMRNMIWH